MWKRRARLLAKFQPGGRLLDVGTGDGRFLQTCAELGYQVPGTEVSQAGADYARRRGLDVWMGQIVDLELPRDHFDVVTIWHVLEHVPDPRAVLQKVHSLLKTRGILFVAVPNEENFFLRDRFGKARGSPFDPLRFGGEIHLTYFRPAPLRTTLSAAGFRVIDFGVDDAYHLRDLKMRAKLAFQQWLAGTFRWHFAVAMYAVARREKPQPDSLFSPAA
ncbi:MAG: methyltransferase domain-containing protein [Chthoniobacterales bacterium]